MIGPRIYPSGAMISQTSGHGDFRFAFEVPRLPGGPLSHSEVEGIAAIADSPDEVRLRSERAIETGREPDQADGGWRRQLAVQSDRIDPVHRSGDSRCGRSRRKLGHLRHRARIHAACDPAGGRRRRQVYRARPVDRRANRQVAGGQGHLVELAAPDIRRRCVCANEPRVAEERHGGVRRNGERLQAGEEVQGQDGIGCRHPVRCRGCQPAGSISRQ